MKVQKSKGPDYQLSVLKCPSETCVDMCVSALVCCLLAAVICSDFLRFGLISSAVKLWVFLKRRVWPISFVLKHRLLLIAGFAWTLLVLSGALAS